jgi:hypothetical protein
MTEPVDDDSVLEQVDEFVDVILGEDLEPPEPEDRWERRQRILDSWTAIILAVAAVATAWASFQAIARADAGRAATAATADTILDSQMWLSWVAAVDSGQKSRADFLDNRFSSQLQIAQKAWLSGAQVDAQGVPTVVPSGTPLDLPSYVVPKQVESDTEAARAEQQLAYADTAASTSTKFVLLAVLLALVLFFASVATKFTGPKVQVLLTGVALILLVTSVIRMLVLPQYVTGRPDPPPDLSSAASASTGP